MTSNSSHPRRRGAEIPVFGIIILSAGIIALLNTVDVIEPDVWWDLWRLWPLLLVLLGVKIIFGRLPPLIVAIVVAASVGVIVVFAWAVSDGRILAADLVDTSYDLPRGDYEELQLEVHFGAGKLNVRTLDQGDERLMHADFRDRENAIKITEPGPGTLAKIVVDLDESFLPFRSSSADRQWTIFVNPEVATRINLDAGAGDFSLELGASRVTQFDVNIGAASLDITAPEAAGNVVGRVKGGASDINVRVPDGVEARINNDSGVSSVNIDEDRFPKQDGVHESAGYATAENRLDLTINAGASSIEVR